VHEVDRVHVRSHRAVHPLPDRLDAILESRGESLAAERDMAAQGSVKLYCAWGLFVPQSSRSLGTRVHPRVQYAELLFVAVMDILKIAFLYRD
jgi:hypothetical protein